MDDIFTTDFNDFNLKIIPGKEECFIEELNYIINNCYTKLMEYRKSKTQLIFDYIKDTFIFEVYAISLFFGYIVSEHKAFKMFIFS